MTARTGAYDLCNVGIEAGGADDSEGRYAAGIGTLADAGADGTGHDGNINRSGMAADTITHLPPNLSPPRSTSDYHLNRALIARAHRPFFEIRDSIHR